MAAVLTMQHKLLDDSIPVQAAVDVKLVLESLKGDQTRVGEWLNVIGYITAIRPPPHRPPAHRAATVVRIQALLVWSSHALDLQRYEASVRALGGVPRSAGGGVGASDPLLPPTGI